MNLKINWIPSFLKKMIFLKSGDDEKVLQIANLFIQKGIEANDPINHLKIQKLMYISYGWYLLLHDKQLFRERMEAWKHGIVISSLFNHLIKFGHKPIWDKIKGVSELSDNNEIQFLSKIWNCYGKYSSHLLTNYSHLVNSPFVQIYKTYHPHEIPDGITVEDGLFREYFQSERERMGPECVDSLFIGNGVDNNMIKKIY